MEKDQQFDKNLSLDRFIRNLQHLKPRWEFHLLGPTALNVCRKTGEFIKIFKTSGRFWTALISRKITSLHYDWIYSNLTVKEAIEIAEFYIEQVNRGELTDLEGGIL